MTVDYERFLAQLRRREAADLIAQLKTFLSRFAETPSVLQMQRRLVASFLDQIYAQSVEHPAFCGSDEHEPPDLENIREGWEKLVMSKIHGRVFGAPGTDETRSNAALHQKIESFAWVEERHLDIPISFHLSLEVAQAELLRINGFKAPRDKFVILQNTVQIVADLVRRHMDGREDAAGNDNLLPTLILVVLRANPPNMISNIKYIMRFRNAQELEKGQNQFCLTNVMGAISFIYNMTASSLTLNENERRRLGVPINPLAASASTSSGASAADGSVPETPAQLSPGSVPSLPPALAPGTTSQRNVRSGGAHDFNRIAGQVSQFFGNIMREVRTIGSHAADEISGMVSPQSTTPGSSIPSPAPDGASGRGATGYDVVSSAMASDRQRTVSAGSRDGKSGSGQRGSRMSGATVATGAGASASAASRQQGPNSAETRAEQEEFELQLALALSLSEASAAAEAAASGLGSDDAVAAVLASSAEKSLGLGDNEMDQQKQDPNNSAGSAAANATQVADSDRLIDPIQDTSANESAAQPPASDLKDHSGNIDG